MNSPDDERTQRSFGRNESVRVLVGGILFLAASLKAYQLATEPTPETGLMTSRWFLVAVVEFEILLGLLLVCGLLPRVTWLITLGCFALFTCVSLWKALSGEVSCGCFGSLQVNPWYTTALDAAAVTALLRCRPVSLTQLDVAVEKRPVSDLATALGAWLVVGMAAAWGMARFEAATVGGEGEFTSDSEIVILEPQLWVGKPFPLRQHIDMGERLVAGKWTVLLYHHDCSQCQEVCPRYERLARELVAESVALIEVPPYADEVTHVSHGVAVKGKLRDTKDWFVQTPAEIRLEDGMVTSVRGAKELEEEAAHGS